jgi:hypothetical protein
VYYHNGAGTVGSSMAVAVVIVLTIAFMLI